VHDRSYIYRTIFLFSLGWAVLYADRTVLYPMLAVIGNDFQLTGAQTGLITSAYFFVYVAMQIPTGLLGDRLGAKRILVVAYFLAGVGMLAVGLLATEYRLLLLLVGLHGMGAGAFYPAVYGITMATVPATMRGISTALVSCGMSLGLALGLAIAGPLYNATLNWRIPFLVLAIPTLVMPFLFAHHLKDARAGTRLSAASFTTILRNPNLMRINAALFCSMYGFWVVVTWGPTFFQTERGLGLTMSGLYLAVVALTAIPAAIVFGKLSDSIGRRPISLAILPLSALTVWLMAYVQSQTFLLAALVVYGLVGKLAWEPVVSAWIGDYAVRFHRDSMGAVIGVFNFFGMSSAVVAPVVSGLIRDWTGSLLYAFYVGAALIMLGFLLARGVPEADQVERP
jgi:MFS family permease